MISCLFHLCENSENVEPDGTKQLGHPVLQNILSLTALGGQVMEQTMLTRAIKELQVDFPNLKHFILWNKPFISKDMNAKNVLGDQDSSQSESSESIPMVGAAFPQRSCICS